MFAEITHQSKVEIIKIVGNLNLIGYQIQPAYRRQVLCMGLYYPISNIITFLRSYESDNILLKLGLRRFAMEYILTYVLGDDGLWC